MGGAGKRKGGEGALGQPVATALPLHATATRPRCTGVRRGKLTLLTSTRASALSPANASARWSSRRQILFRVLGSCSLAAERRSTARMMDSLPRMATQADPCKPAGRGAQRSTHGGRVEPGPREYRPELVGEHAPWSPARGLTFFTASMAYSTCFRRPSGAKIVRARSYLRPQSERAGRGHAGGREAERAAAAHPVHVPPRARAGTPTGGGTEPRARASPWWDAAGRAAHPAMALALVPRPARTAGPTVAEARLCRNGGLRAHSR